MKQTLYIEGMHCPSCELLIEKKLLKHSGVKSADASLKTCSVTVDLEDDKYLDLAALNNEFLEHGYKLGKQPVINKKTPYLLVDEKGSLRINWIRLGRLFKALMVIAVIILVFFLAEKLELGRFVTVNEGSAFYAFFLLGLVAGLSSCAALIGGLLLSLTKRWHEMNIDSNSGWVKTRPHLMFHIGRLLSFFVLGGVLGLLGHSITFGNNFIYAAIVIIVSMIMLLTALQMLGVSWAYRIMPRLPKYITRSATNTDRGGKIMPFMTGVLTFFLPCGFTLIAQGIALTTGSFLYGGLTMLYFAFGTLPILAGISWSGLRFTKRPHMTARFMSVAGLMIVFFAIYNINGQFNVLGWPSLSDITLARTNEIQSDAIVSADGRQTISLIAEGFSYIPNGPTTIKAGVPTRLLVEDRGILGCGVFLSATGLMDGFVALKPGINEIDLGTPSAGSYKITCSMGMVSPVTIKAE